MDAIKYLEETKARMEQFLDTNEILDLFTDAIYGETDDGGLIIGYGVSGSANLVVYRDRIALGGVSSAFDDFLRKEVSEFFDFLENC